MSRSAIAVRSYDWDIKLSVDFETGEVSIDESHQSNRNSTPMSVWHGHGLQERLRDAWVVYDTDLSAFLEQHKALLGKAAESYESKWDGSKHKGSIDSDLHEQLEAAIAEFDAKCAANQYFDLREQEADLQAFGLTGSSTDVEIEEAVASYAGDASGNGGPDGDTYCDGDADLVARLIAARDEAAEEAA